MPDAPDRKWHQFPEAVFVVNYALRGLPKPDEATTEHLLVDAPTFGDVEDFALGTVPDDWEVTEVEKTYVYAKMYGGDDGKHVDVQIDRNGQPTFLFANRDDEVPHTHKTLGRRDALKRRIQAERTGEPFTIVQYKLEDGGIAEVGGRVYNHYDRAAGVIVDDAGDGWFDLRQDDGKIKVLNGERTCTLATARRKGWLK